MTKLAIIQALMPVAKMLIEKLFDLFKNDTSTYNNSAKTDEDTDEFLKNIEAKLPEVQRLFEEEGIDFKTSGDLDTSDDVQTLIDALETLKTQTSNPADVAKIDEMIESLSTARDQLEVRENEGKSSGEDDFRVETNLYPSPGTTMPFIGSSDPRLDRE